MKYFWDRVSVGGLDECWEWKLSLQSSGYGQIGAPQARKLGIPTLAHRTAYLLTRGSLPKGPVLHSCDNRRCCNPGHLRSGTPQENMDDRRKRWKNSDGKSNYNSKLSPDDIRRLKNDPLQLMKIMSEKKVSKKSLTDALRGRTWKHI